MRKVCYMTDLTDSDLQKYRELSKTLTKIVMSNGKAVEHTIRMPVNGQSVVIDALNVVVDSSSYGIQNEFQREDLTDKEKELLAFDVSGVIAQQLGMMFGQEYSELEYTGKGANFYRYAFRIGDIKEPLGLICLDNKKTDTILIMLYGAGCRNMPDAWEHIFYNYLQMMTKNPKITRIDLAHDDFEGAYSSPEKANKADTQGKFALTNKKPSVQLLGDWKRHSGKGRTIQVGTREGGKLFRGYEKGKQLGDSDSLWFRSEVELSNKNRVIPLDVLTDPTGYFVGCYPYCMELIENAHEYSPTEKRIMVIEKIAKITFEKAKQIVKHQFGKYLRVFRDYYTDKQILDMLVTDKSDYYPERLATINRLKNKTPYLMKVHFDRLNYKPNKMVVDYGIPFENHELVRHQLDRTCVVMNGNMWAYS